jgi:hypothetical protein
VGSLTFSAEKTQTITNSPRLLQTPPLPLPLMGGERLRVGDRRSGARPPVACYQRDARMRHPGMLSGGSRSSPLRQSRDNRGSGAIGSEAIAGPERLGSEATVGKLTAATFPCREVAADTSGKSCFSQALLTVPSGGAGLSRQADMSLRKLPVCCR